MAGKTDVVIMSSKGQVVVPSAVRDAVAAQAGTEFVVYGSGDTIVFKKIALPKFSQKELEKLVAQSERKLKRAGFVTEDECRSLVREAIEQTRRG